MSSERTGKLVVVGGATKVEFLSRKGNPTLAEVGPESLSAELASLPAGQRDGVEVTFELAPNQSQQARKVRRTDEPWTPPAAGPSASASPAAVDEGPVDGDFHNPYTFIPALPRATSSALALGDAGDGKTLGHDRLHPDRWEGVLEVVMTVRTPLLVPDTGKVEEIADGHKVFPLRLDAGGAPQLPATGVKGMLRAAHEAVTNSRFGVFDDHGERLSYRDGREKQRYPKAPRDLLDDSLRPARSREERSPSDRLFGWVSGDGQGAWRGQVRLTPPRCDQGAGAVERVDGDDPDGLPLAILSAPKPTQVRFYGAADDEGTPHEDGWRLGGRGYRRGEGLRGRKAYVYDPGLPGGYWNHPAQDRTQAAEQGRFQEYRRPGGKRDDQNRSVRAWVKPGTTFRFAVHVHGASSVDLGGLLWLLTLEDGCDLRLGGGKPLGFGRVHLALDPGGSRLADGPAVARAYGNLDRLPGGGEQALTGAAGSCVAAFKRAVLDAEASKQRGAESFEVVGYIEAFLAVARGVRTGLPVHYPRARPHGRDGPVGPDPEGKNFEWFMANEQEGSRHALPGAAERRGLPMLDRKGGGKAGPKSSSRGASRGRGRR